jgi:hypothetical protein
LVDPNSGSKFPRFSFDNLSSLWFGDLCSSPSHSQPLLLQEIDDIIHHIS